MKYNKQKIEELMLVYKNALILKIINPRKKIKSLYFKKRLLPQEIIILFDKVFNFIGDKKKNILINEFVYKQPKWWKKEHKRSSFFKIKKDAIFEFNKYFK